MIVAGIIAEYNPFHEGHAYMLKKVREELHADYIVVAMSGSFTQRGIPAFFDKFSRTEAALKAGADIVLELPVNVSTGSGEFFATGGVKLLSAFGVTHLAFGSECGDIKALTEISKYLTDEPEELKELIKAGLSSGLNYPVAVSRAVSSYVPEWADILSKPNNTLGIEYIKAISAHASSITPYTISRLGSDYNDENILEGLYPSATALRLKLAKDEKVECITDEDLSSPLMAKLLSLTSDELVTYADMDDELANRLLKSLNTPCSLSELYERLKTKQITMARIKRALLHVLLDIKNDDMTKIKNGEPEYIRVLGIKKAAGAYLKSIKEASEAPILVRLAVDSKVLGIEAKKALDKDLGAYRLYRQLYYNKYPDTDKLPPDDYRGMIVL